MPSNILLWIFNFLTDRMQAVFFVKPDLDMVTCYPKHHSRVRVLIYASDLALCRHKMSSSKKLTTQRYLLPNQARDFFQSLLDPNSCLHSLLPAPRDHNLVARLRAARRFPALASRTKKCHVLYKFRPLKLSVNLGPTGKSLVHLYLYYFYCFIFTLTVLCTTVYVLYRSFTHGYFVLYMAIRPLWPQS